MLGAERLAGAAAAGALAEPRPRLALRRRPARTRSRRSSTRPTASTSRWATRSPPTAIPAMPGFDLPRGAGTTAAAKRTAIIPDPRNDENLAVAQTHLAFIRFHNRVVDTLPGSVPPRAAVRKARELVTKHYQWMIRTDFLPRICRASRSTTSSPTAARRSRSARRRPTCPTMPIEFSVAAYRLGHSMVRAAYNWNKIFDDGAGSARAPVHLLGPERRPRRRPAPAEQLDRRLPPALRLRRGGPGRSGRAGGEVQPRDAHRHEARRTRWATSRRTIGGPAIPTATRSRTSPSAT